MQIDARKYDHKGLNEAIRACDDHDIEIVECMGQRFIAAGIQDKAIKITGTPGNALGAYLDGATIEVFGNAQDAIADTMNSGRIIIHGNAGDTAGYGMRGGEVFIEGNAGYRTGVHMKAYKEKLPIIIIGGRAGSFVGEYQAGGIIVVLDLLDSNKPIVGNFPSTGMHGGKVLLMGNVDSIVFPEQVNVKAATAEDLEDVKDVLKEYCETFMLNYEEIIASEFAIVTPNSENPYRQMYVSN